MERVKSVLQPTRMLRGLVAVAFATVLGNVFATPALQADPGGRVNVQPELIEQIVVYQKPLSVLGVKPSSSAGADSNESNKLDALNTAEASAPRFGSPLRLRLPRPMTEAEAMAWAAQNVDLANSEGVLVDRAVQSHGSVSSNDSLAYLLWNLAVGDAGSTRSEPVWSQGRGNGVTVAVLDTGKLDHPDMQGVWVGGYDFLSDTNYAGDGDARDADPTDAMTCTGSSGVTAGKPHGLQVASIIAARLNNNEGLAGVAPEASILPVRVISSCGGYLSDVLDAMRWAAGLSVSGVPDNPNPAKVLNLSLGTTSPGATCGVTTQAVIDEVLATGASIVVSTGNDGTDSITVPAACNGVIAVAAASKDGKRTDYSNAGTGTSLAAAGGGCASDAPASCASDAYNYVAIAHHTGAATSYLMGSGTSYAAPHVAGAAALLIEQDSSRLPAEIKSLLTSSAQSFAPGACDGALCGAGIMDVQAALSPQNFTVSAAAQPSIVRSGNTVELQATVGSGAIAPVYSWQQTAGDSVVLSLDNGGQIARFTAPEANTHLAFQVSVTDNTATTRTASTNVTVSITPVLAAVDPIRVEPGETVRHEMILVNGGQPAAIAVDAASIARGVTVEGNEVVWAQAPEGEHALEVTPYDNIGSGVPAQITVDVSAEAKSTGADASQNPMGGGGGGLFAWHGAVLLLLAAWLLRTGNARNGRLLPDAPRTRANDRAMKSASHVAVGVGAMTLLVAACGLWAPQLAYQANGGAELLWMASWVHIDGSHLVSNLIGLALVQIVFSRVIDVRAWAVALLVIAPIAHSIAIGFGAHDWVSGLSTALHGLVAWSIALFFVAGKSRDARLGLLLLSGLVLKLVLDTFIQTHWHEAGAVSSPSLHVMAAVIGFAAGMWVGYLRIRAVQAHAH